jgi:dihydroorotate dehydrogenase
MRALLLSLFYLSIRKAVIQISYTLQFLKREKRDLESAIVFGDTFLCMIRRFPGHQLFFSFGLPNLNPTSLYDLEFPTPITFAAFKSEIPIMELWLKLGIGGGCIKTVLKERRLGNPRPRIQEAKSKEPLSIINAMGLPGPGLFDFLNFKRLPKLFKYNRPVGFSVGGCTPKEYKENAKLILEFIERNNLTNTYLEINISCPNTHEGQDLLSQPDELKKLLEFLRKKTNLVIGVKLSPDQTDENILTFVDVIKSVERTYVNLGNTQANKDDRISVGKGGLSGSPLFERTLEMIGLVKPSGVPIIATGGITDVARLKVALKKGATLVGLATALVVNPYTIPFFNKALTKK